MRLQSKVARRRIRPALAGVHKLINALLRFQKSHPERRPISYLPIPFRPGNDIAKSVGFKPGRGCVSSVVQAITDGGERRLDLGRWRSLYFADAFSIGLDVAILAIHNAMEAALGQHRGRLRLSSGYMVYAAGAMRTILRGLKLEGQLTVAWRALVQRPLQQPCDQ